MKSILCLLVASIVLLSCSSGLQSKDLQGSYGVHQVIPAGNSMKKVGIEEIQPYMEPFNWQLVLASKNNFQLLRDGRARQGYWTLREAAQGEPNLLFQSEGKTSLAIYADGQITFLQPQAFFDSLVTSVSFERSGG